MALTISQCPAFRQFSFKMHSVTGLEVMGNSSLCLSIRILIPLIHSMVNPEHCRTLVVYYHNDTVEVASEILKEVGGLKAARVSINIDDKCFRSRSSAHPELGTHLFNIYVMKNLNISWHQHKRTIKLFDRQATNYYFMVIQEKPSDQMEISQFFRMLWTEYKMISAVAFILGELNQVYTHFPYKNRFAEKMDEVYSVNLSQVKNPFRRYFLGKANDLENTDVNAYITENIPKSFRLPSKYRRRNGNFYFGGRDGYIAKLMESILNVQWQYKTIDNKDVRKILNFGVSNTTISYDLFGNRLDYNDENPPNLQFRPFDARLPISWERLHCILDLGLKLSLICFRNAYNDCEISFKAWRITTINRLNDFKGFLVLERDDSVLLIQNHRSVKVNLSEYAAITLSVMLIYFICVLFRWLFRLIAHEKNKEIGEILLNTWGALLLTNPTERILHRPERILNLFFVVFSMWFGMLASAILLGNILAKESETGINTLKELAESKLPICISTELNQTRSEWASDIEWVESQFQ